MANYLNRGIEIFNGFTLKSATPIDTRLVCDTREEMQYLVDNNLVYESIPVYCRGDKTLYRWEGGVWEPKYQLTNDEKTKVTNLDTYLTAAQFYYKQDNGIGALQLQETIYNPLTDTSEAIDRVMPEASDVQNGLLSADKFETLDDLTDIGTIINAMDFTNNAQAVDLNVHYYNLKDHEYSTTVLDVPEATRDLAGTLNAAMYTKLDNIQGYIQILDTEHANVSNVGITYDYVIFHPADASTETRTVTIPLATSSENGLISSIDFVKLGRIVDFMTKFGTYVNDSLGLKYTYTKFNPNTNQESTHEVIIPLATHDLNGLMSSVDKVKLDNVKGYLVAISYNNTNDTFTLTTYNPNTDSESTSTITLPLASEEVNGLMSKVDKYKLNDIVSYLNDIEYTPSTNTFTIARYTTDTHSESTFTITLPNVSHTIDGLMDTVDKIKLDDILTYLTNLTTVNLTGTALGLTLHTTNPNTQTDTTSNIQLPVATQTRDGLMSAEDKAWKDNSSGLTTKGTTSTTWQLDTDASGVVFKNSGGIAEIRNSADSAYSDLTLNNITIKGNVTQEGQSFITKAETVQVTDNILTLNNGETGAGVTKSVAGIEVDRGTESKYMILFDESDDRFKVGEDGDLWPVALRDDESDLSNGSLSQWNASTLRYEQATAKGDVNTPIYIDSNGVATACTSLDLNTTGNAATADKVNHTLTMQVAGENEVTFNGSEDKTFNVTLPKLGVTATATELNILDGITATTTELNYTDGVTSNIQTQINNLNTKIDAETTRATGVEKTLQTNINNLEDALTETIADVESELNTAIKNEESARIAADNVLDGRITTEVNTRSSVDADLQNQIDAEETARVNAVKDLQGKIDALNSGGGISLTTTGEGNAVTSISKNGSTITATKGSTFLTSHQSIFDLTLQAGIFSATTFDPNGAAKTVNIPTTTSHISEGNNLYFTNARAISALSGTLSGYMPLTGGTLTGKLTINTSGGGNQLTLNNTGTGESYFYLQTQGKNSGAFTTNHPTYGTAIYDATANRYLGITSSGTPHFQSNTLAHAGNCSYTQTSAQTYEIGKLNVAGETYTLYGTYTDTNTSHAHTAGTGLTITGSGGTTGTTTYAIADGYLTKIDNGATAFGWGNHANAGYTKNTGTVTSVNLIQGTGITVSSSNTAITTSGSRTISLNAATTSTIGGIAIGYTTSGKNYAVQLDANNRAYVNVPWTSGSGGSSVSISNRQTSGTRLATITVDDTVYDLYYTDTDTHPDLSSYATKSWVQNQGYLTSSSNIVADRTVGTLTINGTTFDGSSNVNLTISGGSGGDGNTTDLKLDLSDNGVYLQLKNGSTIISELYYLLHFDVGSEDFNLTQEPVSDPYLNLGIVSYNELFPLSSVQFIGTNGVVITSEDRNIKFNLSDDIVTDSTLTNTLSGYLPLTGGTLTGSLTAPAFYQSSDARLKFNIADLHPGRCSQHIVAKTFDFTNGSENNIGYIAQEVQQILPNVVQSGCNGYLSINYTALHTALIQDLTNRCNEYEKRISELEAKLQSLNL